MARGLGALLGERIQTWWVRGYGGKRATPRQDAQPLSFASPDYVRPTPPPRSGYHRYQLRLYQQPADAAIALSPEERVSLGKEQPCPRSPTPRRAPRGFFGGTDDAVCWGIPTAPGWGCSFGAKGLQVLTRDAAGATKGLVTAWLAGSDAGRDLVGCEIGPSPCWHIHPPLPKKKAAGVASPPPRSRQIGISREMV